MLKSVHSFGAIFIKIRNSAFLTQSEMVLLVRGQASPNSLHHAELVSGSQDHEMLKQVQHDDSTIVEPDLLLLLHKWIKIILT